MSKQEHLQSLVHLFNEHSRSNVLITKRCAELKEEKHYIVHYLKKVDTKVGDAVIAALSDSPYKDGDAPKFQVFLPKRFTNILQNEDLDSIEPGTFYIISHGQSGNNSTELTLNFNNIDCKK